MRDGLFVKLSFSACAVRKNERNKVICSAQKSPGTLERVVAYRTNCVQGLHKSNL